MSENAESKPSLVLLCGRPAAGKTTVGQELERIRCLRLFHIHQVVDLVTQYFPWSASQTSPYFRLVVGSRMLFLAEAARTGLHVITTAGWRFDRRDEDDSIRGYIQPFLEFSTSAYRT